VSQSGRHYKKHTPLEAAMSIVLSPDVERQIEELVRSGRFESVDDCIRKSVQLMHDQEIELKRERERIDQLLEEGIRDFEEGRFTTYDEKGLSVLIEEIKREGREQLAAQTKSK
jgi:putative addiction module CopG family antidote